MSTVTEHIDRADAAGPTPGLVRGPWRLPSDWVGWAAVAISGRRPALTIDGGWHEAADTALVFVKRFV